MTSRCEALQEDLKAFQDGELSLVRRLAVGSHLARCAACREEIIIMEQIGNEVRSTESGTLDPALRAKILTNIASEAVPTPASPSIGQLSRQPRGSLVRLPHFNFLQWGAAAMAVLITGAIIYPTTQRARENARRTVSESNLKQLPGSVDASYDSASPPSAAGSAPSGGPVGEDRNVNGGLLEAPDENRLNYAARGEYKHPFAKDRFVQDGWSRIAAAPSTRAAKRSTPRSGYNGIRTTSPLPSTLRRVHKEARITVEVKKLEEQSNAVESMVKSAGGFVVSNTLSTAADGVKTAALDIKVPVKQFETVVQQIGDLGEVKAKNVSGQDLTEQVSDAQAADNVLSSELSVKEAMLREARLKAAKKKDLVLNDWQQRAEVRRLRVEAAQVRARLELLRRTSDLSNISIQLQEKPHLPGEGGFAESIGETGRAAFESFLVAARVPINLLIWILAYSPLWIPLLIAYHYMARVYGRRTPPP